MTSFFANYIKKYIFPFMILISLFLEIIHYKLYVKAFNIPWYRKAMYMIVDAFHILFYIGIFTLILNPECNIMLLLLLNAVYIGFVLSFFIFRKCILSIIENKLLGTDDNTMFFGITNRILYLMFPSTYKYKPEVGNGQTRWIQGNIFLTFIVLLLDTFCFTRLFIWNRSKSC